MAAKIKAYAVQEQDEWTGGIVFARGPAHARMLGSSIHAYPLNAHRS